MPGGGWWGAGWGQVWVRGAGGIGRARHVVGGVGVGAGVGQVHGHNRVSKPSMCASAACINMGAEMASVGRHEAAAVLPLAASPAQQGHL